MKQVKHIEAPVLPVFRGYMVARSRYCVLYGGAGAGKSYAAAQKMVLRALGERGIRILVVRKVEATLRQSCFATLLAALDGLGLRYLVRAYVSRLALRFWNGSEILCVGCEDVERLMSIFDI